MFFLKTETSVLPNNRFGKQAIKAFKNTTFSKTLVDMQFLAKKNAVAQKQHAISRQQKMAFSTPRRVVLGLPSPSPRFVMGGWVYADVITKISRIDRLPNLRSNGAPL